MLAALRRRIAAAVDAVAALRFFKPAVFIACAIPAVDLGYRLFLALTGRDPSALGADPAKFLEHETGRDALGLLLITLSVTPVRRLLEVNRIQRVRRMLGVWSFTYALVHLSMYLLFDRLCYSWSTCEFATTWEDLTKRKFIFVGMAAFTILLALAITSTGGWVRRLKKNWQRLHRLVYVAAVLAVIHFAWGQKADITEPLEWGAALAALLGVRVFLAARKRRSNLVPAVSH